jgi:hypothetical protein
MNTNINAESLSAQISKQITVVQATNPLTEAEAGNDQTILQNLNSQANTPSVVLVDNVSRSQKTGVAQQIDSSSQPTQIFEAIDHTQNPLAQFSLEDDSNNLHVTGVTIVQNQNNHDRIVQRSNSLEDDSNNLHVTGVTVVQNQNNHHHNRIVQHSDSLEDDFENLNAAGVTIVQNHTKRTIVQYSDSAIHNPAETTVCQAIPPLSTNRNQTLIQSEMPKSPHIWQMFRTLGSFWRKIDLKQLQSLFHLGRQPAMEKILEQPSLTSLNYHTHNAIASGEQPSLEQYQKKLRELDLCRLCFAKELARNGKFRNAIFEAEQISETSYFFKDAQMLIQSWN